MEQPRLDSNLTYECCFDVNDIHSLSADAYVDWCQACPRVNDAGSRYGRAWGVGWQ